VVKLKGIFFGKVIPKKINIWEDCSLPLRDPIPGSVSFGFGYRHRLELPKQARLHANRRGLDMVVINIHLRPLTVVSNMDWSQRGKKQQGMINIKLMPLADRNELSVAYQSWVAKGLDKSPAELNRFSVDWDTPSSFVTRWPQYIPKILDAWKLQAVAHAAHLDFGGDPLMVATMRPGTVEVLFVEPEVTGAFPDIQLVY